MRAQNTPGSEPAESDPSLAWDSRLVTFRDRSSQPLCDPYSPSGTSWRATKMVVQGARERMFGHIAPIRMPCSRSSACCPVVPRQISRPGMVAVTWAGLIERQTIKVPFVAQDCLRPRSRELLAGRSGPIVAGPAARSRSDARTDERVGAACDGVGLDRRRQTGGSSDRMAGKDMRTGRIDWQRADLSGTGHPSTSSADESALPTLIYLHKPDRTPDGSP